MIKKVKRKEPPGVKKHLQVFWNSFFDLHRRRQWHQAGPQPISTTQMKDYLSGLTGKFSESQQPRFFMFISALDDTFIEVYAKKQKDKAK